MATTEYEPDGTVMGREALRHGALRPLGVRVAVRGHLHLCLANVGENPLLVQHKGLGGTCSCYLSETQAGGDVILPRTCWLLLFYVFNSVSYKCAVTPGFKILSSEERLAPYKIS